MGDTAREINHQESLRFGGEMARSRRQRSALIERYRVTKSLYFCVSSTLASRPHAMRVASPTRAAGSDVAASKRFANPSDCWRTNGLLSMYSDCKGTVEAVR